MTQIETKIFCANHPTIETSLRCNRCEKPICTKCAVLTPTGYRCRECINNQQKIFNTAVWQDYLLAFFVATILSFLGSILINILPIAFLTIFIAPLIGTGIGEAVRITTRKRRSNKLNLSVVIAILVGSLPILLIQLVQIGFFTYAGGVGGLAGGIFPLVWQGVYLFLAVTSAYYRISGIRINY